MKYNPIFQQEVNNCLQKFRGMGLFRSQCIWIASQGQFRIFPTSRSGISPTAPVIIQLSTVDADSWYYQPTKPRHRFFRRDYASCYEWLQHAVDLSNGNQPFARTSG